MNATCKLIRAANERHLKTSCRHLFSDKVIANFNMFGKSMKLSQWSVGGRKRGTRSSRSSD